MLTRRDIIIKWSSYGAATLAMLFLFSVTLRDVKIAGVTAFLPPLIVGVIASVEDTKSASSFALLFGLLCDLTLPGTFPCVYTLAFTLASLACSALSKSVLQPGFLCSLAVTGLTFFFVDAFNMLALALKSRASFASMAGVALRETALTCLLLVVCHPVLMWLHRKFTI